VRRCRRNADERIRRIGREAAAGDPEAQAALKRARDRALIADPELPGPGCFELRPLEGHPGWVEIYLDGRRVSSAAYEEGSEGIENFINYSIGERARQGWWYEAIKSLHYPSARCWGYHFPPPRYLHPKQRRRVRRRGPRRYMDNPDEDLRGREREAASGDDPESLAASARVRRRSGEDVRTWEQGPIGQIFYQAFLLGKEGRVEAKRKDGKIERFYLSANRLPDRGAIARGPMFPFPDRWPFYDWQPWVDGEGVVVVPQEPIRIDTNGALDTLYKIAVKYTLTPDEIWKANEHGHVEWRAEPNDMDPVSVSGIHPHWTAWDSINEQGSRPPGHWQTGHYGAYIDLDELGASTAERWRFHDLYDPWVQSGTVGAWGTPHWITVPPSGRWSVLFKTPRNAGRNGEFGERGMRDDNALRPSDYEWARIMTKKGKAWKNPWT
jgi:hypothetical protein